MEKFEIIQNLEKNSSPIFILINNRTSGKGLIRMIGDYENIIVAHNGKIMKIKMSHALLLNMKIATKLLFLFTKVSDGHIILSRMLNDCENADWSSEKWVPILSDMKIILMEWIKKYSHLVDVQNAKPESYLSYFSADADRTNELRLKQDHYTLRRTPDFGILLPSSLPPVVREAKKVTSAKRGSYGEYRTELLKTRSINLPTSTLSVVYSEKDYENMSNRNPFDD